MGSSRMPAVYLSHGAPTLADDPIWPGELAAWAKALPRRTEHFAPLFVTLGAGESDLAGQRPVIEGFWGGLAKRSVQLG